MALKLKTRSMWHLITFAWERFLARTEGPMSLRIILEPLMALVLTFIAARRDIKKGFTPYMYRFWTTRGRSRDLVKEAWKAAGIVFVLGVMLDLLYQSAVVLGLNRQAKFYPLESLLVALVLAVIPYWLFRRPLNRFMKSLAS
jgi:hypothetical protein